MGLVVVLGAAALVLVLNYVAMRQPGPTAFAPARPAVAPELLRQ